MKVEIYSDVACPWCYIGEERFERALSAYPGAAEVEVTYRPYQLDPRAPAEARPLRDYLAGRFGPRADHVAGHVVEAARAEGIAMDFDRALAANTLSAHRLMHLAEREHGPEVQRAVARRLFEAHFSLGGDVGDAETLAELAADCGMDRDRVREYLASGEGTQEVREQIDRARRMGIGAVPTFVFEGRFAVQGAQPASAFLQALEAVEKEIGGGEAADGASGEACADGSRSV